jgi:hypothetical protein
MFFFHVSDELRTEQETTAHNENIRRQAEAQIKELQIKVFLLQFQIKNFKCNFSVCLYYADTKDGGQDQKCSKLVTVRNQGPRNQKGEYKF